MGASGAAWRGGVGRGVGRGFRIGGTSVSLWLIHVDMLEKPSQYYKIISSNLNK